MNIFRRIARSIRNSFYLRTATAVLDRPVPLSEIQQPEPDEPIVNEITTWGDLGRGVRRYYAWDGTKGWEFTEPLESILED